MSEIRQSLFQKPPERIRSIKELNRMIAASKEVKEWNLDIQLEPDTIEARVLKRPQIYTPEKHLSDKVSARTLDDVKILGTIVHQPMHFRKWAIFCLQKDVPHGEFLNDRFYELSQERRFDIYVDYGDIVELSNKSGIEAFKEAIDDYYLKYVCGTDSHGRQLTKPRKTKDLYFFLIIMPDSIKQEHLYTALKNKINTDSPVISQFVSSKTIQKYNDRIYINILRQINAKLGGDLWRLNFGSEISRKTMLVGIDVCHKGKQSIIGFCATYDEHMCKYYTQASPQGQKGQEIISSGVLQGYFKSAFQAFRDHNRGELPDHVFIYRDGVGDSMRSQVIDHELEQLYKIIQQEYDLDETKE